MKLKHVIKDADFDDFIVLCNPTHPFVVREHIYKGEQRERFMNWMYNEVSGMYMPVEIEGKDGRYVDEEFLVGLYYAEPGFMSWGDKNMLIPMDNVFVWKIGKEVTRENDDARDKFQFNTERWYLDWHNGSLLFERSIEEYKDSLFFYNYSEWADKYGVDREELI